MASTRFKKRTEMQFFFIIYYLWHLTFIKDFELTGNQENHLKHLIT